MIPEVLRLIEAYKLGDTVRWILENNPSQALPYHNFNHSLWVMYNAAENWQYERPDTLIPIALLLAALFHDFGHSGGFFTNDYGNIAPVIRLLGGKGEPNVPGVTNCFMEDALLPGVSNSVRKSYFLMLIKSTEYPYKESTFDFYTVCRDILAKNL
jgi:hypothetical protein